MANVDFSLVRKGEVEKPKAEDGWHMMLKAHSLMSEAVAKMTIAMIRTPLTGEELAKLKPTIDSLKKAYSDSTELLPWLIERAHEAE